MSPSYRWEGVCPNGHAQTAGPDRITTNCGEIIGDCRCPTCGKEFTLRMHFWQYLGLAEAPPE